MDELRAEQQAVVHNIMPQNKQVRLFVVFTLKRRLSANLYAAACTGRGSKMEEKWRILNYHDLLTESCRAIDSTLLFFPTLKRNKATF